MSTPCRPILRIGLASGLAVCAVAFLAAAKKRPISKLTLDPEAPVVDLFDGIEQGTFDVRVAAKNEYSVNVYITNTAETPQTVKLPKSALGVHVLKQQFPFPSGLPGNGLPLGNNGPLSGLDDLALGPGQTIGGNFLPSFMADPIPSFPGSGYGTGFFSVPPGETVQIPMNSVCLEHGKPAPMPRMTYVLRRVEDKYDDDALQRLLENYDPQKTDRKVMQAAAWHLAGGMSWNTLAAKRVRRIGQRPQRYVTRRQWQAARALAAEAEQEIMPKRATRD